METIGAIILALTPFILICTFGVPPVLIFLPWKSNKATSATITFQQRKQHASKAWRYGWATVVLALLLFLFSPISPLVDPVAKANGTALPVMSNASVWFWIKLLCYIGLIFSTVKGIQHSRLCGWFSFRYALLQRLFAMGGYVSFCWIFLAWVGSDLHGA